MSENVYYFNIRMSDDMRAAIGHYAKRTERSAAAAARALIRVGLEAEQARHEQVREALEANHTPNAHILDQIDIDLADVLTEPGNVA